MSASIKLNDVPVPLHPQARECFDRLAEALLHPLHGGQPLVTVVLMVLAEGLRRGIPATDPMLQAVLWTLHEVGVNAVTLHPESNEASLPDVGESPMDRCSFEQHFMPGSVATGRAMIASMMVMTKRTFLLDGVEVPVKPQPRQQVEAATRSILDGRRLGEEAHAAAARYLGALLLDGRAADDPDVLVAVEIAADLAIVGVRVDREARQATIEGFSEPVALAISYVQGLGADDQQLLLGRIRALNQRGMRVAARE